MKVDCPICQSEYDDEERGGDSAETCSVGCQEKWDAFNAEAAAHGVPTIVNAAMKIMEFAREPGITKQDVRRGLAKADWFGTAGPPERN